jgi:type II secretory pathway component PulK
VLLIVLVVVVMLALSCYTFCAMMQSEYAGARQLGRRIQARHFADSGVEWARLQLAQGEDYLFEAGGVYDNPDMFQGILVKQSEDPKETGLVTIIAPNMDDEGVQSGFRFGLTNESSRMNLNVLTLADQFQENGGRLILMSLPGMDEYTADAILDWIDADDEARPYGAEADYYGGLSPPYAPKNGQPDSVEELLLVKGVTAELLFGADTNHNGIIDSNEAEDLGGIEDESMALGWANFMTLFSKEKNVSSDGLQRVYLNNPLLDQLYTDLRSVFTDELSTFIIAYRIHGPYAGDEETSEEIVTVDDFDLESTGDYPLSQVLDLIDARVDVGTTTEPKIIASPVTVATLNQYMSLIMGNLTTLESETITGRVNINQAPRVVLEGIPGMTPEIAEEIISVRDIELNDPDLTDEHRKHETWILMEGIVDLQTMRLMLPFVCAGGDVYRAEVVGYYQAGGTTSRAEVVFDTTGEIPRLLFWRDKSHLPFGYDPETLGLSYTGE